MNKIFAIILFLFHYALFADTSFDSIYTDFRKDCYFEKGESLPEGSDAPKICKESRGYIVIISYSACMEFLRISSKDGKEIIDLPSQPIGASDSRKLEWRLLNQKLVGVIYRTSVLRDTPEENCPKTKSGKENLEIRGLGKYSKLTSSVPSEKKANEKARSILELFVKKN